MFEKIPLLKNFKCFFGKTNYLEKGWKWLYMGFGNYLLLRNEYFEKYKKYMDDNLPKDYESGCLYNKWYNILIKIVKEIFDIEKN